MADTQRLEQALRAAHEAGDTAAAQKLATALRQARASSDTAAPEGNSLMRRFLAAGSGFNEGLANVIGAPVDLVNYGLDKVGFPVSDEPLLGSNSIKSAMRLTKSVREPDPLNSSYERAGRNTGEGFGTILGIGAFGAAAKGTRAGKMAQEIARPATGSLTATAAQIPAEAAASAGAEIVGQKGEELGQEYFGETGGNIGRMAGGILGASAPAASLWGTSKAIHSMGRRTPDVPGSLSSAEVAQALDNSGIEKSGGLVGNRSMARTENTMSYLPVGGGSIRAKQQRQVGQFADAAHETTSRMRGGPAADVVDQNTIGMRVQDMAEEGLGDIKRSVSQGEKAISETVGGLNSAVQIDDVLQDVAKLKAGTTPAQARLIDTKVNDLIAMKTKPIDANLDTQLRQQREVLVNTLATVDTKGARGMAIKQQLADVETQIDANLGVDYDRLRQWRNEIGRKTEAGSIEGGNAKQIYSSTTRGLEDVTERAGVRKEFDNLMDSEAQVYASKGSLDEGGDIGQLRSLIEKRDSKAVFEYVNQGAKQRPERLELLKRNTSPERWNEMSADLIDHMGRAKPGQVNADAEFSPSTFLSNWETMPDRSKNLLAGDERKALDDLADAARAFRSRQQAGNPSGTLASGINGAVLFGLATNPVKTISAVGAGSAVGNGVASDAFADYLAKNAPKLYNRIKHRLAGEAGRQFTPEEEEATP